MECSIGESGGEQIRGWVAPVSSTSFHSTGYPRDIKFPRRQQIIYHIIGNEGGGTPALQLPDGKGRRREVKTRQAEPGGDGGVRGN